MSGPVDGRAGAAHLDGAAIHAQLEEVARALEERAALLRARDVASRELSQAEQQVSETRRMLDAERADVVRLEGFSFERLAATFRGTRADDLMRERAEEARAEAAHATALARASAARADVEDLSARIEELGDLETWRRSVLTARGEWLRASGHPDGVRLEALATELGAAREVSRELDEALIAARRARDRFDAVLRVLDSAESWATFDLFGGGFVTDMVKHSKIDEAQALMRQADDAVRRLQRELADVDLVAGVDSVGVTEGTKLMDMFFDDIFSAMSVRRSVQDARARCRRAREAVQRVERLLGERSGDAADKVARLSAEREAILEV